MKIHQNVFNNHKDNWDVYRFGPEPLDTIPVRLKRELQTVVKYLKYACNATGLVYFGSPEKNGDALEYFRSLYEKLGYEKDQDLLISILVYRILGSKKIKLITNNKHLEKFVEKNLNLVNTEDFIQVEFNHLKLERVNLAPIGIPLDFYFSLLGVYTDFEIEQYKYRNTKTTIVAKEGDYVIDAGGCWGDTALYFGNKVGENGKVFCFEFIPSNLKILKKNLALNPEVERRVSIVEHPVWEESGLDLAYIDNGPGSKVFFDQPEFYDGKTTTLTIDDLVHNRQISKIDFVKMDIEGAELSALQGAEKTIRQFKPSLAIALYHSGEDFFRIPSYIDSLDLGYKFFLGHYTIHQEETILFATIHD